MKTLLLVLAIVCLLPSKCFAMHVQSLLAGVDLNTDKVVKIVGEINSELALKFTEDMALNIIKPGPLLIYINSPGGEVGAGQYMIDLVEASQAAGTQVVCVVDKDASSMAFNLLSYCNKRLYTSRSFMVVHKIALSSLSGDRFTAKKLRDIATMMEAEDEGFRQKNAPLMKLTLAQYDTYADMESCWTGDMLFKRGYFQGVATIGR